MFGIINSLNNSAPYQPFPDNVEGCKLEFKRRQTIVENYVKQLARD